IDEENRCRWRCEAVGCAATGLTSGRMVRQSLCKGGPMFKHAYQFLTALIFLAWLVVPATQAQSIILKADIPFDFVVGEKRFPSGEYHVKSLYQAATEIRGKDARSTAIILTTGIHAGKISDVGKLVFNHYGDYYFLSRILAPSS